MATHPVLVPPPGPSINDYLSSDTPPSHIPAGFVDAMAVRKNVFVDEQKCRLENEIDSDDARAYHWVVYASMSSKSSGNNHGAASNRQAQGEFERRRSEGGTVPVSTLRLVPPPHGYHPNPKSVDGVGGDDVKKLRVKGGDMKTCYHDGLEPYVKIGRMATVAEFRGLGLGKLMVNAALDWAAAHEEEVESLPDNPVERERVKSKGEREWMGLTMAHAQITAVRFYQRLGFEVDDKLGKWIEEGIEHVAMWKRLDVKPGGLKIP
ncbi:MAG: hypothetical protein MMC23_004122 [Stictis urceolatum]|nr:hypothetical protein [Stictis urceolata]